MSNNAEAFEHWIRTSFVQMNTELEELYFAQGDRSRTMGVGDNIKHALRDEGHTHVASLRAEGNTGEGFDSAFGVLGNVGMYLGALRRHELTNPAREERSPFPEASSLAVHCGASLGMAPRFATAHLTIHNRARAGLRKSHHIFALNRGRNGLLLDRCRCLKPKFIKHAQNIRGDAQAIKSGGI